MMSLFQRNCVIRILSPTAWWRIKMVLVFRLSVLCLSLSLSFSRNRWMQDYRCDFRQRLDRTADALSGRVRGKHGRHRQGMWAWWIRQGLSTPVCVCGVASSKALVNKKSTILRNNVFIFALLKELGSAFFIFRITKSFCFQRSWNNLPKRFSSSSFNNLKHSVSAFINGSLGSLFWKEFAGSFAYIDITRGFKSCFEH